MGRGANLFDIPGLHRIIFDAAPTAKAVE